MARLEKLNWKEIPASKLPAQVAKAYAAYQAKNEAMTAERTKFEEAATAAMQKAGNIPAGQQVRFSHRWGKLSYAFTDAKAGGTGEGDAGDNPFA